MTAQRWLPLVLLAVFFAVFMVMAGVAIMADEYLAERQYKRDIGRIRFERDCPDPDIPIKWDLH